MSGEKHYKLRFLVSVAEAPFRDVPVEKIAFGETYTTLERKCLKEDEGEPQSVVVEIGVNAYSAQQAATRFGGLINELLYKKWY